MAFWIYFRRVLGDISNRQPNSANTEKTRKEIEKPKRVDDIQSMKEKKFGVSQPSPTALDLKQSKVTDTAPRKSNMGSIVEEVVRISNYVPLYLSNLPG